MVSAIRFGAPIILIAFFKGCQKIEEGIRKAGYFGKKDNTSPLLNKGSGLRVLVYQEVVWRHCLQIHLKGLSPLEVWF